MPANDDEGDVGSSTLNNTNDGADSNTSESVLYRAIKTQEEFYPRRLRRSFMLCATEKWISESFTDILESNAAEKGSFLFGDTEGKLCRGILMYGNGNRYGCKQKHVKNRKDKPRRMTLFTLNHGELSILR